jgi:purine-cytosine permease-like protein
MPLNTPRWKLFVATYAGILVPTVLVQALGMALASGTQHNHAWKAAFVEYGVGGPLALSVARFGGWGKLLLVFAALSSIPNNIPNNYSFAMHAQNFGPWAIRIPRIVLVTFGFVVAVIVGCLATKYFDDTLSTFLSIIGYWTIVHLVVVAEEHIIFRGNRWSRYDWDAWQTPALLPFGWGAIAAFLFGFAGAILGMKVAWFVGPVAKLIGTKGANVGHELSFAFSATAFPIFRYLEKKYTGK